METNDVKEVVGKDTIPEKDMSISIAYQNKDIVSKLFGDQMKGKSLSLFGMETDLKVVDARPTNIPIVQVKELRLDNLFELEDGSIAIMDYESDYEKGNFCKYGRYIMEVIDRYLKEGKEPDIRMMVLYTADIEKAETVLERTACKIQVETSYLMKVSSEEWLREIRKSVEENVVTDEVLMHLVILPLTYKGKEKKQKSIRECVELARRIKDKKKETFVLAGILSFTDKVITEETREHIKEVLGMTQVGKMLMDEGRQLGIEQGRQQGRQEGIEQGRQETVKKTAMNMLKRGDSLESIAEVLDIPIGTIKAWEQETCAIV